MICAIAMIGKKMEGKRERWIRKLWWLKWRFDELLGWGIEEAVTPDIILGWSPFSYCYVIRTPSSSSTVLLFQMSYSSTYSILSPHVATTSHTHHHHHLPLHLSPPPAPTPITTTCPTGREAERSITAFDCMRYSEGVHCDGGGPKTRQVLRFSLVERHSGWHICNKFLLRA